MGSRLNNNVPDGRSVYSQIKCCPIQEVHTSDRLGVTMHPAQPDH